MTTGRRNHFSLQYFPLGYTLTGPNHLFSSVVVAASVSAYGPRRGHPSAGQISNMQQYPNLYSLILLTYTGATRSHFRISDGSRKTIYRTILDEICAD